MAVLFIAVAMAGIVVGFAVNNRRMFTKNKGAVAQVSATPVITQQTAETKEPDSRYYMPSFEGMTKQQALLLILFSRKIRMWPLYWKVKKRVSRRCSESIQYFTASS